LYTLCYKNLTYSSPRRDRLMKSMTLTLRGPLSSVMLASLLATAAACAPGRFSVEGACVAQAKAICKFQYNCCNASERQDQFHPGQGDPYDDESSCVEVYTR